jgi:hypothetical protein
VNAPHVISEHLNEIRSGRRCGARLRSRRYSSTRFRAQSAAGVAQLQRTHDGARTDGSSLTLRAPGTRTAPGVFSLVAELRGHERQAAEELEQWKTHHEERRVIDASPAAVTLAMI